MPIFPVVTGMVNWSGTQLFFFVLFFFSVLLFMFIEVIFDLSVKMALLMAAFDSFVHFFFSGVTLIDGSQCKISQNGFTECSQPIYYPKGGVFWILMYGESRKN